MQLGKSVSFINLLIQQTKNGTISWDPLSKVSQRQSFPQLDLLSSYYCKTSDAHIAIGNLLPQYKNSDSDISIFICIDNARTFSLIHDSEIGDAQDDDLIRSKILRLYNLINYPDSSLEKFIDDYLGKTHQ